MAATKITTETKKTGNISFWVKPEDLQVGDNTRQHTPESIAELAASMKEHGQKVPAIVRVLPDGALKLVAGAGRREAALINGSPLWVTVDTSATDDKAALITQIIENVRRNLTDLEEARVNEQLIRDHEYTATEVAKLYGRDNTNRVGQLQKLLTLPEALQQAVHVGKISLHAAIQTVGDSDKQAEVLAKLEAGEKQTAAETTGGSGSTTVKRNAKHIEAVIAELEGEDEKPEVDERVIKLLAAVVKYLKGTAKTDQGLKAAIKALDDAIG